MTNAQKWIAAFLGLFLVLFMLQRLTQDEEIYDDVDFYGGEDVQVSADNDALSLINRMSGTKESVGLVEIGL